MKIPIDQIIVPDSRRPVDPAKVAELAESIRQIGLLNPVTITRENRLVAGAHRLAACKSLDMAKIDVSYIDGDSLQIELAEIDENLIRNELHYIDRADALARRKEIYESLHPEVKRGAVNQHTKNLLTANSAVSKSSFVADTSTKTGVSERTVYAEVQLAQSLEPTAKETLKAADLPKADALKLARMPKERQIEIAERIKEGKAKTVKEAELIDAKRKISEQTAQAVETNKPTVHVGDGIEWIKRQKSCDLLITDPPYSTDVPDIDTFAKLWLPTALSRVKPTGFAYIFVGAYPEELRAYTKVVPPKGISLEQILVWTYKNTLGNNPVDRYKLNWQAILFYRGKDAPNLDCPLTSEQWAVMEMNAPDGRLGNRYHAWQKPIELAERLIRHSTKPGDTVLDPFCCTGTFLLAAAKLGRRSKGCEINIDNAAIAVERGCVHESESF